MSWLKLVDTYITGDNDNFDVVDERYNVEKQLNIIKNKMNEDFEKCENINLFILKMKLNLNSKSCSQWYRIKVMKTLL